MLIKPRRGVIISPTSLLLFSSKQKRPFRVRFVKCLHVPPALTRNGVCRVPYVLILCRTYNTHDYTYLHALLTTRAQCFRYKIFKRIINHVVFRFHMYLIFTLQTRRKCIHLS